MSIKNQVKPKKDLDKFIKNDVDDFWGDCMNPINPINPMNAESSLHSSKMNSNETGEQYITFNDIPNKKGKKTNTNMQNPLVKQIDTIKKIESTTIPISAVKQTESYEPLASAPDLTKSNGFKNLVDKYNFEHLWTPEELEERHNEEQKKKKAIERCFILYERGKIKNEVNRIMYHKNEELKIQSELKKCTWKPHLNKLSKKLEENLKVLTKDTKIYNRAMTWKFKNNQKISRSKSVVQSELLEYTYRPMVNSNPNLNNVFDQNKTILKDYSNRSFVFRYEKARDDEVTKQKKVIPDLSKQLKNKWSRSILNRSSSMNEKESNIYKQTLHNDLINYEFDEYEN